VIVPSALSQRKPPVENRAGHGFRFQLLQGLAIALPVRA
jgi:hypothetical protein